jgi:hypothetical protein
MLTTAQLQTLKTDIAANTNTVSINGAAPVAINSITGAARTSDATFAIAAWYNLNTASFWVWQAVSSTAATGMAIKMSDVGNLTTANSTRLQVSFQIRPNGFTPSVQDDRALFGSLFSVSGASGTRANLLATWQRLATNVEKLFATGTGTQAGGDLNSDGSVVSGSPATLVVSGPISGSDVLNAWNS